jgi:coenzyme F420-reducing hydrogenase alpha subunit
MVVKQRTGWGYETLVREVSDSLHLRRFCLIALGERVPHESTVHKAHAPARRVGGRSSALSRSWRSRQAERLSRCIEQAERVVEQISHLKRSYGLRRSR